jgi:hypothetical protein
LETIYWSIVQIATVAQSIVKNYKAQYQSWWIYNTNDIIIRAKLLCCKQYYENILEIWSLTLPSPC